MSKLGLGIMINSLEGGRAEESAEAISGCLGQRIVTVKLEAGEALVLSFENGSKLRLQDDGRSCCENRYMVCDDNLPYFAGSEFRDLEVTNAEEDDGGNFHEVQFLVVHTDKGDITVSNHNEHNGYYGGISLIATREEA